MILLDTSVWIDYFNRASVLREQVNALLDARATLATTGVVEQEVLQGFRHEKSAAEAESIFDAMFHVPIKSRVTHRNAARTYRLLRRRGMTVRSPIDCLIAELCIEHSITIWHKDRDFDKIALHRPLSIFQWQN